MRATVHTTLKASPTQLVFGRDARFNIPFTAKWQQIRKRKQSLIDRNKKRENKRRRKYEYSVQDKILIEARTADKYSKPMWQGPYVVLRVNNNGTLRIQKGALQETINIRRVKPYATE